MCISVCNNPRHSFDWRRAVLEDHRIDTAIPLNFSRRLRGLVFFILLISSFAIFYSWDTVLSKTVEDNTITKILVFGFTLLYILYFYIVFDSLILKSPPEKIFVQQLIFPFLLFCSYFSYFLFARYQNEFFKYSYIIWFFLLYFFWLLRDNLERKSRATIRFQKTIWVIIESFVLIIFGFIFWSTVLKVNYSYHPFLKFLKDFGKDIAVLFSVLAYYILNYGLIKPNSNVFYRGIYNDFLRNLSVDSRIDGNLDNYFDKSKVKKVLDFGCGNGQRLLELLSLVDIKLVDVEVYGYDELGDWADDYYSRLPHAHFTTNIKEVNTNSYDLIYISHVLYTSQAKSDIIKIIKKTGTKSVIFFRGNNPNSIFATISYLKSTNLFVDNKSHFWYDYWLDDIAKKCKIKRLKDLKSIELKKSNRDSFHEPDVIIKQSYKLRRNTIQPIILFLEYLYDENLELTVGDYLHELVKYNPGGEVNLPCDDFIYIYNC